MKKFAALLLLIIVTAATLISCGGKDGAPEGLELIAESDEGFTMYGPEGWTVINSGYNADTRVYGSRLSGTSNTSITFVRAEMPTVGYTEYFEASLAEFPASYGARAVKAPSKASFGNAEEAYSAIYSFKSEAYSYETGKYELTDFTCLQFYIKNGGKFYLFTYTAKGGAEEEGGDYLTYLELVYKSVENFEFGTESAKNDAPEYERDGDGYLLVTDKRLAGFDCYIPEGLTVVNSSGSLDVAISDGAAFSLSKISYSGNSGFVDYFDTRISELTKVVSNYKEISRELTNVGEHPSEKKIVLGNLADSAVMGFEYSYTFEGKSYRVYEIMGMNTKNAFTFTYTAVEGEYSSHLPTIEKIIEKIKF